MMHVVSITGLPSSSSSGKQRERRVPFQLLEIFGIVSCSSIRYSNGGFVRPKRDQDFLGVRRERVPEEL